MRRRLLRGLQPEGELMKVACGDGRSTPKAKRGYSLWMESGTWYTAPKVSHRLFGPHAYDVQGAYNAGTRDCPCGCFMLSYSSGGPVDPRGPCPKNPRTQRVSRNAFE